MTSLYFVEFYSTVIVALLVEDVSVFLDTVIVNVLFFPYTTVELIDAMFESDVYTVDGKSVVRNK
jgi:hypothetical protein